MKPISWPKGTTQLRAGNLQQGLLLLLSYHYADGKHDDHDLILKVEKKQFRVIGYKGSTQPDGSYRQPTDGHVPEMESFIFTNLTNPEFLHTYLAAVGAAKTLQIIERSDLPLLMNFKGEEEFLNFFKERQDT